MAGNFERKNGRKFKKKKAGNLQKKMARWFEKNLYARNTDKMAGKLKILVNLQQCVEEKKQEW